MAFVQFVPRRAANYAKSRRGHYVGSVKWRMANKESPVVDL